MDLLLWKRGVFALSELPSSTKTDSSCEEFSLLSPPPILSSFTQLSQILAIVCPWLCTESGVHGTQHEWREASHSDGKAAVLSPQSNSISRIPLSKSNLGPSPTYGENKKEMEDQSLASPPVSVPPSLSSSNLSIFLHKFSRFPSLLPVNEVSQDTWNVYWKSFSETCSDEIDSLIEYFSSPSYNPPSPSDPTCSVLSIGSHPRSVQIWVQSSWNHPCGSSSASEDKLALSPLSLKKSLLLALVVFYARRCGAIELVEDEKGNYPQSPWFLCCIHFTTHAAAIMFYLWFSTSMDMKLLWDGFRADLVSYIGWKDSSGKCSIPDECRPSGANKEADNDLVSILSTPTPFSSVSSFLPLLVQSTTATVTSPLLLLGFNVFFPTVFVDRLFRGMMQASEVRFLKPSRSFLISFTSITCARTALHILQHSLWSVFGLTLISVEF